MQVVTARWLTSTSRRGSPEVEARRGMDRAGIVTPSAPRGTATTRVILHFAVTVAAARILRAECPECIRHDRPSTGSPPQGVCTRHDG